MQTVIGLMSGTSMDGVDAAVLVTDGITIAETGPTRFRPYDEAEKTILRKALEDARNLSERTARPGALGEAEAVVTAAHGDVVEKLRADYGRPVQLIGFHGQTVFHAPERRLTVQIGDGKKLADRMGLPVVFDFRAADVAAGGQGAPFVPLYHQALVRKSGLEGNVVVANVGGVANITRIGAEGGISSGDTGPGNALMDDMARLGTGESMDMDGRRAATGKVDQASLRRLIAPSWFDLPMPKSLDRNAFSLDPVRHLRLEDALATLAAFTATTLAKGIAIAGGADTIVVSGGGAHNPVLLKMLADATGAEIKRAADLGWDGDFIEAQAFAYLAARSVAGLPLSLPETTGVPYPMPGGVLAEPSKAAA
ncbi:MAG TPA: anhydro-N-acetylmuramic acid kinase [Bauldia sp.]|nr:anhydro-N-acetylmuramic acid kinase [Bauldia sp.]